jgi:hypothetical protein
VDPVTGTGCVGKDPVQEAFGWNNGALQKNAADVTFELHTEETVALECTGNGFTWIQLMTLHQLRVLNSEVSLRGKKQLEGWNLDGFSRYRMAKPS